MTEGKNRIRLKDADVLMWKDVFNTCSVRAGGLQTPPHTRSLPLTHTHIHSVWKLLPSDCLMVRTGFIACEEGTSWCTLIRGLLLPYFWLLTHAKKLSTRPGEDS